MVQRELRWVPDIRGHFVTVAQSLLNKHDACGTSVSEDRQSRSTRSSGRGEIAKGIDDLMDDPVGEGLVRRFAAGQHPGEEERRDDLDDEFQIPSSGTSPLSTERSRMSRSS